jgi:hypothetical protein
VIDGVASDSLCPDPNTRHPGFTEQCARDLRQMPPGSKDVMLLSHRRLFVVDPAGEITVTHREHKRVLMHSRAWAKPAPYVGKPFVYLWQGWIDDYGRWVTGEALMVHHPEMPAEMETWPDYWYYHALPER